MKQIRFVVAAGIALMFFACGEKEGNFQAVNSLSFDESQIIFGASLSSRLVADSSLVNDETPIPVAQLDDLIAAAKKMSASSSDSVWNYINKGWADFKESETLILSDTSSNAQIVLHQWAELNMNLLKLTGEVRFGDALEKVFYDAEVPVLSENALKSVVYTHVYDQIYINLIGSSNLTHRHTTGGIVKLIQETTYPAVDEMILKCECADTRYLDVFIRIPEWAVNPTVTHGNVKYVARSGEYCQISRKWKNGDEFQVRLKN
jgi:hypothetical protein